MKKGGDSGISCFSRTSDLKETRDILSVREGEKREKKERGPTHKELTIFDDDDLIESR